MRIFSLVEDFSELREVAQTHPEGRSSVSLHEGECCVLRQTATALLAGHSMKVARPPIEGWVLVLEGHVKFVISNPVKLHVDASKGTLMQLPLDAFSLTAIEDSLLLLTVAMGDRPGEGHDTMKINAAHQDSTTGIDSSEYAREVWEDESPAQQLL